MVFIRIRGVGFIDLSEFIVGGFVVLGRKASCLVGVLQLVVFILTQ